MDYPLFRPILKMGSQFFGRCRFLRIGNFHLVLPKSIKAFFRVPAAETQLRNWAKMDIFQFIFDFSVNSSVYST